MAFGLTGAEKNRLRALSGQAAVAEHVELHAMPNDLAGNIVTDRSEQTFHRCRAELADDAASRADGVVVMLDARKAVLGAAIHCSDLADDACLQQQLDSPIHRRPPYGWDLFADLLRSEAFLLSLDEIYDRSSRDCRPVSLVLKYGHQVGTGIECCVHSMALIVGEI